MKKLIIFLTLALTSSLLSAQGYYLEYKLSAGASGEDFKGSMKMFYQDGNSRAEMEMQVPALPGGSMRFVTLALEAKPGTVYLLDEKERNYSELSVNGEEGYEDYAKEDYEITVLGKEKVNGYNSVHVKVKVKNKKMEEELWTSTEVSDYAGMSKIRSKYTGKDNLAKALEAKGAGGFPVRIMVNERGRSVQLDLINSAKRKNPAVLFSLDGYEKNESGMGLPGNINVQDLMQKMQNMTPEEQEKMMDALKQQYGQKPR